MIKNSLFFPTIRSLRWDLTKLKARFQTKSMLKTYLKKQGSFPAKLHFGSGKKKVNGWLNIDITNSDINVDFSKASLPLPNNYFESIVSQHVIEHLELKRELEPMLIELYRILKVDGFIYLSCPCIKKICESYINDGGEILVNGRKTRDVGYSLNGYPSVQIVNELFRQGGTHFNLFDYNLLSYILKKSGFTNIKEISEKELLDRFPQFPSRNDGEQTLYVCATKI